VTEPATPFTDAQIQEALAVLDREQPSPIEQRRFRWLTWAVGSVFALSTLWVIVLVQPSLARAQLIPLWMAAIAAAAVPVLLVRNLPFFRKCWRALWTERRLGISRYVSALGAKVRSQARWVGRLKAFALIALVPIGLVFVGVGGFALIGELWRFPPEFSYLPLPLWTFTFGITCLFLYPMEVCRQRLDVVGKLRAALANHNPSVPARDLVTAWRRTHIVMARQESAERERAKRRASGLRFAEGFLESLSHASEEEMIGVYASLPLLQTQARAGDKLVSAAETRLFDVPDTSLKIAFRDDPESGDIVLEALHRDRDGGREPPVGDESRR
jgi:hypothetical protein